MGICLFWLGSHPKPQVCLHQGGRCLIWEGWNKVSTSGGVLWSSKPRSWSWTPFPHICFEKQGGFKPKAPSSQGHCSCWDHCVLVTSPRSHRVLFSFYSFTYLGAGSRSLERQAQEALTLWRWARARTTCVKRAQLSPWEVGRANQTWRRGSKESHIRQGLPF